MEVVAESAEKTSGKPNLFDFHGWEALLNLLQLGETVDFLCTSVLSVINSPGFLAMPLGNPSSCLHLSKGGRCSLWRWQPAREQCHQGCLSDISPWTGPSRSFAGAKVVEGRFLCCCVGVFSWRCKVPSLWFLEVVWIDGNDQGSSLSSDGQSCGSLRASVLPSAGGGSGRWVGWRWRSNFDLLSFSIFFQTSGSNLTFLSAKTLERCLGEWSLRTFTT